MRLSALFLLSTLALGAQEFPTPKPTPHHLALRRLEGTWDAVVKVRQAPGKPPMVSKGVEVNRLVPGGLWLTSEFRSELSGVPFEGRGIFGYDPATGKHVGTWVDSTVMGMAHPVGTCRDGCRETTMTFEGPGMDGKPTTFREVSVEQGPDRRLMTMYIKGPGGTFSPDMEIEYTRRK